MGTENSPDPKETPTSCRTFPDFKRFVIFATASSGFVPGVTVMTEVAKWPTLPTVPFWCMSAWSRPIMALTPPPIENTGHPCRIAVLSKKLFVLLKIYMCLIVEAAQGALQPGCHTALHSVVQLLLLQMWHLNRKPQQKVIYHLSEVAGQSCRQQED